MIHIHLLNPQIGAKSYRGSSLLRSVFWAFNIKNLTFMMLVPVFKTGPFSRRSLYRPDLLFPHIMAQNRIVGFFMNYTLPKIYVFKLRSYDANNELNFEILNFNSIQLPELIGAGKSTKT